MISNISLNWTFCSIEEIKILNKELFFPSVIYKASKMDGKRGVNGGNVARFSQVSPVTGSILFCPLTKMSFPEHQLRLSSRKGDKISRISGALCLAPFLPRSPSIFLPRGGTLLPPSPRNNSQFSRHLATRIKFGNNVSQVSVNLKILSFLAGWKELAQPFFQPFQTI